MSDVLFVRTYGATSDSICAGGGGSGLHVTMVESAAY